MRIEHMTLCVSKPTRHAAALIAAIAAGANLPSLRNADARTPASEAPAPSVATAPTVIAIGAAWGAVGTYAGLSRGEDGQPDGHLVLLDAVPEGELKWADAVEWAEGLGDGARLPTRLESALLYANLRDKFDTGCWYWTGTQYSADNAWLQFFGYGYQDGCDKKDAGRARAVRLIQLDA